MLASSSFSFDRFEDTKCVSSLDEFLCHVDGQYDCDGFEHIIPIVAKDIAAGVNFLHARDIVHRDIKASNVLVSNQRLTLGLLYVIILCNHCIIKLE